MGQVTLDDAQRQHNSLLSSLLSSFSSNHSDAVVVEYNTDQFYNAVLTDPTGANFTDAKAPCSSAPNLLTALSGGWAFPICDNPSEHVFWDVVGPFGVALCCSWLD